MAIIIEKVLLPQPYSLSSNDLMYAAFAAKSYMNDDIEMFSQCLEEKFTGFRENYQFWISSHLIEVTPKKLNKKFLALNIQPTEEESLIDYNFYVDEVLELALLEHLGDDVAAADELPVDEQLRDRRPVRPLAEDHADARVREDVAGVVLGPHVVQDLHHLVAESAARRVRRALHVEEHFVVGNVFFDAVRGFAHSN